MKKLIALILFTFSLVCFAGLTTQEMATITASTNLIKNPGFEALRAEWRNQGGTLAIESTDPLFGKHSLVFTPLAQGDYVESSPVRVPRGLQGKSCEASIDYLQGSKYLSLQVLNADNVILGEDSLITTTVSSVESVFFTCPPSTATENEKLIRVRIINSGAVVSPSITFDKTYAGRFENLVEAQLPDSLTATINPSTDSIINGDWLDSFDCGAGNVYSFNYASLGLQNIPKVDLEDSLFSQEVPRISLTTTEAIFDVRNLPGSTSTGICNSIFAGFSLTKVGSDARQTAQVFKVLPVAANNTNTISGRFDAVGNLLSSNIEGQITGSNVGNARYEVDVSAANLQNVMACSTASSSTVGDQVVHYDYNSSTNTTLVFRGTFADANNVLAQNFSFTCEKQGSDFILPLVQPVIVGQVRTNSNENYVVRFCNFRDGVSAVNQPLTATQSCNSWVTQFSTDSSYLVFDILPGVFPNDDISCRAARFQEGNPTFLGQGSGQIMFRDVSTSRISFAFFSGGNNPFLDGGTLECKGRL